MAMTKMAPKSSMTASAVKNIFREMGTFLPKRDRIPKAKAMSVAIGIPQPEMVSKFELNKK